MITELQPRLTNHFAELIKANKLSHAYLLAGPAGVGKKELALWVAQGIFCLHSQDGAPCRQCNNCQRIAQHEFSDVVEIAPDGNTIKVDQIRFLKAEFTKSGFEGRKKIFIIEDAEKMTANAANSLLKFLEEPSGDVSAFLLTQNANLMLPTIISRCQVFELTALAFESRLEALTAQNVPPARAHILASLTDSLEQGLALAEDESFNELLVDIWDWFKFIMNNDLRAFVNVSTQLKRHFTDKKRQAEILDLIVLLTRDVMLLKFDEQTQVAFMAHQDELVAFANKLNTKRVCQAVELVLAARKLQAVNVSFQNILETLTLELTSCYHE